MADTPNTTQPSGVSQAQANANLQAVSKADATATDNSANRKTDPETGRPLLDVKMEAPKSTSANETAPTKDASEKKRDTSKEAPVQSVAQLRDAGIAKGVAPTSKQVEEMRKIETDAEAELSKQIRKPGALITNKK